jgi:hypothetical protein
MDNALTKTRGDIHPDRNTTADELAQEIFRVKQTRAAAYQPQHITQNAARSTKRVCHFFDALIEF